MARSVGNWGSLWLNLLALAACGSGLVAILELPLPPMLATAGHKQFLTNISLACSLASFAVAIAAHLARSDQLFEASQVVHITATVLECLVSLVYWPLRLLFRDLILPPDASIPMRVDLAVHMAPALFLLADYFLFLPSWKLPRRAVYGLISALTVVYWFWLAYLIDGSSVYPYPFLNIPTQWRILVFASVANIAFGVYLLIQQAHFRVLPPLQGKQAK